MRMLSPINGWSWKRSTSPDLMGDVFSDFDRMVDGYLSPAAVDTTQFPLACDVHETKEEFLLSFDMPGVKKDDIKIEVHGTQLRVSGERNQETKVSEGEQNLRREKFFGKYERTFELPSDVNADKIEAHYENGVLRLSLPKAEAAKPRLIEVRSAQ